MNQKTTTELLHILTDIDTTRNLADYVRDSGNFTQLSFAEYYNSLPDVRQYKYTDLISRSGINMVVYHFLDTILTIVAKAI